MQRLIEGVHRFRADEFGRYRALFKELSADGQNPHTLFITCSDSRVIAELITQSKPGDLFVVKNVGNIVPPANVEGSTNSTAAAIEFAVEVLKVSDIVVCGHSHCGAMAALLGQEPIPAGLRHLAAWLELAAPVRNALKSHYGYLTEPEYLRTAACEENVLFGLENLQSYPSVRERLSRGTLHLHAWYYEIATGALHVYDPDFKQFAPLARP